MRATATRRSGAQLAAALAAVGALAGPLAPAAPAQDAAQPVAPRAWEHERSDLPVNPRLRFGALPSGLRYAWLDNPEPERRVYLRLHVDAGSLVESDDELGMAHFLEHMAFQGSRRFAPGELVAWLQRQGLGFGGDTNALTDFSQTVYQLDLPANDEALLQDGLHVLRDVVDGLLLQEAEVAAEKGVIDGEERERESAPARAWRASLEALFAGTRIPTRLPIGTKSARDAFDGAKLRAFWQRWYRPEKCTLLVVGDLDGREPTAAIAAAFGDLAPRAGPPAAEAPLGTPRLARRGWSVHDPELPNVSLDVQLVRPYVERGDDRGRRLAELPLALARTLVNLRFHELTRKPGTPFLAAQLGAGGGFDALEGEALNVVAPPAQWAEALAAAQLELRRALQHGFAAAELDEVRAEWLHAFAEAARGEATRSSEEYVAELLAACERRMVPTDAAADQALFEPLLRALTPEACHAALARAWGEGTLVIGLVGPVELGAGGGERLLAAWDAGAQGDVAAAAAATTATWAYAADPARAGEVAARSRDAASGFERIAFANGVRLFVQPTPFKERELLLRVLAGEGALSLAPERTALRFVAERVLAAGGLGRHGADELRRLTAGRQASIRFQILDDAFAFTGATTREDLALQCELACAYVTDPGLREEGATQLRRALPQFYEALARDPAGVFRMRFVPRLYGDDPRVALPPLEAVQAVSMAELREWLTGAFDGAPITVVAVGDLDLEATVAAVARTFGALPARRAPLAWEERRAFPAMKTGLREELAVDSSVPKALVAVQFATTDGRDAATRRSLAFLADVVQDRLRVEVRERLAVAYSPGAGGTTSMVHPGHGSLVLQALAEPAQAGRVADALLAVADRIAREGVAEEEVARLRPELLARLRDQQRMNLFWLDMLGGFHSGRPVEEDLRTLLPHAEATTARGLSTLAKRYLQKELASIAIVMPGRS